MTQPTLNRRLRQQIEHAACGCHVASAHGARRMSWCNVCGRSACHTAAHTDLELSQWWAHIQRAPYEQRHLTIAFFMG